MKEKVSNFLQYIGYMQATTTLPEFQVFFLPEGDTAEVVVVIDYLKEIFLSKEIYSGVRERFVQLFKEQGFGTVHMMTLVLHQDISVIKNIFYEDIFCWYLNATTNILEIPNGHVEDFYGIKSKIQPFLENPDAYMKKFTDEVDINMSNAKLPKKLPFVNISIVCVNIIIFILCAFVGDMLYNKGAFSFLLISDTNQYYRLISSVFLHVDVQHLFSNMLVLYFLGNIVEEKIGHIKYLIVYFVSAIAGNFLSAIYEMAAGEMIATVGASGAVFGVMGSVLVLLVAHGGKWENITLPRMLIMLVYSLYIGFTSENINNAAHIGGFLTGLLVMTSFCIIKRLVRKKEVLHEN